MKRWAITITALLLLTALPLLLIESPLYARVTAIVGICLYLWLSDTVPPFVPTLLLWSLIPLVLGPTDPKFGPANVLSWAVDPVMALFFGGFTLGVATEVYGLDKRLARFALRSAGKSFSLFLLLVMLITALLSMWMSNIAAAAMVIASLRPVLRQFEDQHLLRRLLLVGVAIGADLGGMATPIGTGPNAIAIASIAPATRISFDSWMLFALPLTSGMLLLGYLMLLWRARLDIRWWRESEPVISTVVEGNADQPRERNSGMFILLLAATAVLWLTEPLHGIPAAVVSLGAAAVIFMTGMLKKADLLKIDWSSLLLIAGGITLGRLLEQSGLITTLAASVPFAAFSPTLGLFVLCLAAATLSAVMSNTATAVMLIPLGLALMPQPSTAILIAISASFGIPFVISTPQNAMAYGEGGVRTGDFFWPGMALMVVGCAVVSLTGRAVLSWAGIP